MHINVCSTGLWKYLSSIPIAVNRLWLILLLCMSFSSYAQFGSPSIRGQVVDSASLLPLDDATIWLCRLPNLDQSRKCRNQAGGFHLNVGLPGEYQLVVSYLGYRSDTTVISIHRGDTTSRLLLIKLYRMPQTLTSVVV